jgi:uncharacterized protein
MSGADLDCKLERMREIIRSLDRVVVAFSAGVDSTLVLKVAVDELGRDGVIAATSHTDSLAEKEYWEAIRLAELVGAPHVIVETDEFQDPNYLANPTNRCYFCKTALYTRLEALACERGFRAIVNGANADDLSDWRPGLQAADEHGVRAPAAEAGLTKAEVRALSKRFELPTYDKPASPCLSSRVQYGEAITPRKLRMIESCEEFLREMGLEVCRVRHHDRLARIEVPPEEIARLAEPVTRRAIEEHFRSVGYSYVALDLTGFRSGSMNETVALTTPNA